MHWPDAATATGARPGPPPGLPSTGKNRPPMKLPVIFINLDSDADRRLRMQAEFARLGLRGERFDATRWTALSEAEQARLYSPQLNAEQFHKSLVNGEKGCYASHLRCWQSLLE